MHRLVFTASDDWFSKLTRAFTKSPTSHVAIALGDHNEYLLHVHDDGVVLEPREAWFSRGNRLVAEYAIIPDVSAGVDALARHLGEPWSAVEAARIAVRRLLDRRPLRWVPRDEHTCAQFVMMIDPDNVKIPEWADVDRSVVAPGDLLVAAKHGHSFRRL